MQMIINCLILVLIVIALVFEVLAIKIFWDLLREKNSSNLNQKQRQRKDEQGDGVK